MKQKKYWFAFFFLAAVIAFGLQPALLEAQTNNKVKVGGRYYRKKTVISFGNDTISGDLNRPDGEYFEARKRLKHSKLISLRQNWKKKIRQAVSDL